MSDIGRALTSLARVRDPASRAALALGVTDICVAKPLTNRTEPLANDILLALANKVEESVRITMASRLANCAWAPRGIVRFLAFDAPVVAKSVILQSPVLATDDLIELAEDGSEEHRIQIANRKHIGLRVTDALAGKSEIRVIRALIDNSTARLSDATIEQSIHMARDDDDLARALLDRDDISPTLVRELTERISQAVRSQVEDHFGLAKGQLDQIGADAGIFNGDIDEESEARKLVEQMGASGQLTGTVAVRAVTDGKLVLFDYAIADLCGVTVEQWRAAIGMAGVRATALACRAARIEKSLFPSVLRGMQRAGRVHGDLPSDAMLTAANVFQKYTPGKAHDALRRLAPDD
ncbi:DUF2336 domain-containing protein [Hyphobacterium sp. HN65]|uniref:DUF2336 domain-containing protein n=1 Tax=Hyphobacterium lacteum TaxID=3116575 RepID=A0ABU7LTF0_9PROT|nr:DUF2336 domain-containing protein [Hyphobacterium sp. HN65]MEE2527183.1 DUF2336 domain-containing protein [Hyphobacterium sp. HN65]